MHLDTANADGMGQPYMLLIVHTHGFHPLSSEVFTKHCTCVHAYMHAWLPCTHRPVRITYTVTHDAPCPLDVVLTANEIRACMQRLKGRKALRQPSKGWGHAVNELLMD
jgi:hypothetical protein